MKLNDKPEKTSGTGPMATDAVSPGKTHEGGPGFARDAKTELFLRCTTMFHGEDSFYEQAKVKDDRAIELARELASRDWGWLSSFLPWLRSEANIRTMPIVLAAEAVHARLGMTTEQLWKLPLQPSGLTRRQLVDAVLQRPDEPCEFFAYWRNHFARDNKPCFPMPVKRGLADAVGRMWNQRQALRYDSPSNPVRFGDVIEMCHPKLAKKLNSNGIELASWEAELLLREYNAEKGALYAHLITSRHSREGYEPPETLDAIRARRELNKLSADDFHMLVHRAREGDVDDLRRFHLAMAGKWEWAKSRFGGSDDHAAD